MGGAGAVAASSQTFAGTTATQTAEVNQIRLQAELSRLNQERDIGERRAIFAEGMANKLFSERMAHPLHTGVFAFGSGPPPPPAPVAASGLKADDVASAVRGAMMGERRTLQDLMAHHGSSMKEAIQQAVSSTARSSNEPAPNQPDAPIRAVAADVKVDVKRGPSVSALKKKFEKQDTKKVSFVGGATSPMPTEPARVPEARALTRKERRESIISARPLDQGPAELIEKGIKRNADFALEDVDAQKRPRSDPATFREQERKDKRKATLSARPIVVGPDEFVDRKRAAGFRSSQQSRTNPSAALAKAALDREYSAKIGVKRAETRVQLEREMQRGLDIIAKSKTKNPPRMDQFDLKRQVDAIYDDMRVENERNVKRDMTRPLRVGSFNVILPRSATA
jgi:hypothetical protein